MSWRKDLMKASFQGVAFLVQGHEGEVGRRVQVHEYPLRDKPWAEDLGRKSRMFTLDAYVLGSDYMQQRDALLAAVELPGSGQLKHPYLGEVRATCLGATVRESTAEGGMARFALKFVEAGDAVFPATVVSTGTAVSSAVDYAAMAVQANFSRRHRVAGCPAFVATAAQTIFTQALLDVQNAAWFVRTAADSVATLTRDVEAAKRDALSLVFAPASAAQALSRNLRQLARSVAVQPLDALRLTRLFYRFGGTLAGINPTTSSRRQQAANQTEMLRLVRVLAVCEGAFAASRAAFSSYDEAVAVRDDLVEAMDDAMRGDITDELYGALRDLQAALARDVATRGANLSRVTQWAPPITLPALVAAHRLYADAGRAAELLTRNAVRHPLFVAGGQSLEVLVDAT